MNPDVQVYDMQYTYDQLGNRTTKLATVGAPVRFTAYLYDTDLDPNDPDWATYNGGYVTRNNRLLRYWEYDGVDANAPLLRTVKYRYQGAGQVANISVKDEDPEKGDRDDYNVWHDLALVYSSNGRLWLAIWGHWTGGLSSQYYTDDAWEFRYDGGRERYLARHWSMRHGLCQGEWWSSWKPDDPAHPHDPNDPNDPISVSQWTDYLGEQPWQDYALTREPNSPNPPAVAEVTRYLAGAGIHAQADSADEFEPVYLHGDLIRSTVMMTDAGGQALATTAYTAFGEPISEGGVGVPPANFDTRYGYAGGHGYESGLISLQGANTELPPITLQHVGERWYQPDIGRFVQRDPIAIRRGADTYAYCRDEPMARVDPRGLFPPQGGPGEGFSLPSSGGVPIGTAVGQGWNIRVPKGGPRGSAQSPTKNAVSAWLVRTFGKDFGFRHLGPWMKCLGPYLDALWLAEQGLRIREVPLGPEPAYWPNNEV